MPDVRTSLIAEIVRFVILLCMLTFHATFPNFERCYASNFSNSTARTEDFTYYQAIFETGNFYD